MVCVSASNLDKINKNIVEGKQEEAYTDTVTISLECCICNFKIVEERQKSWYLNKQEKENYQDPHQLIFPNENNNSTNHERLQVNTRYEGRKQK